MTRNALAPVPRNNLLIRIPKSESLFQQGPEPRNP